LDNDVLNINDKR